MNENKDDASYASDMLSLFDQLCTSEYNEHWTRVASRHVRVRDLAALAFFNQWPFNSEKCIIIRLTNDILNPPATTAN